MNCETLGNNLFIIPNCLCVLLGAINTTNNRRNLALCLSDRKTQLITSKCNNLNASNIQGPPLHASRADPVLAYGLAHPNLIYGTDSLCKSPILAFSLGLIFMYPSAKFLRKKELLQQLLQRLLGPRV